MYGPPISVKEKMFSIKDVFDWQNHWHSYRATDIVDELDKIAVDRWPRVELTEEHCFKALADIEEVEQSYERAIHEIAIMCQRDVSKYDLNHLAEDQGLEMQMRGTLASCFERVHKYLNTIQREKEKKFREKCESISRWC